MGAKHTSMGSRAGTSTLGVKGGGIIKGVVRNACYIYIHVYILYICIDIYIYMYSIYIYIQYMCIYTCTWRTQAHSESGVAVLSRVC